MSAITAIVTTTASLVAIAGINTHNDIIAYDATANN
jgi:hypothetical protein